jgi:hypothetical protein
MAQKNFWAWLNMGRDGQPIDGESGSGQQYFASEDRKPSKLWGVAYWAFYLAISVVFFLPMIFALIVIEIGEWIDSVLDWLDEKRG